MKTIILKDVIEKLATREQLVALHDSMNASRYYDLMMNTGTPGKEDDEDTIGVLSDSNINHKDYLKALVTHIGKTKKFWENVNRLVLNVNKEISLDDRKMFHLSERLISDKLIQMLEKEVPSNEEALNEVVEGADVRKDVLGVILSGKVNRSSWVKATVSVNGKQFETCIGAPFKELCFHYQPANSAVLQILREFAKQKVKTLRFDRTFLDLYTEGPYCGGNIESDLCQAVVMLTTVDNGETKEICHNLFTHITSTRTEGGHEVSSVKPTEIEVTMNQEAWITLTYECKISDD